MRHPSGRKTLAAAGRRFGRIAVSKEGFHVFLGIPYASGDEAGFRAQRSADGTWELCDGGAATAGAETSLATRVAVSVADACGVLTDGRRLFLPRVPEAALAATLSLMAHATLRLSVEISGADRESRRDGTLTDETVETG